MDHQKVDLLKSTLSQFENLDEILKNTLKHLGEISRFGP